MMENNDIERLFQESFKDFEVTPPASVKANVDAGTTKKRVGFWWLSALVLVLITALVYVLFPRQSAQLVASYHANTSQTEQTSNRRNPTNTNSNKENSNNTNSKQIAANSMDENANTALKENERIANSKMDSKTFSNNEENAPTRSKTKVSSTKQNKTKKTNKPNLKKNYESSSNKKIALKTLSQKDKSKQQSTDKTKAKTKQNSNSTTNDEQATKQNNDSESMNDPMVIYHPEEKSRQGNVQTEKNNELIEKSPVTSDSSALASTIPDSIKNNQMSNSTNDSILKTVKATNNWMLSAYSGPQFDFWKTRTQDEQLIFKPSFRSSLEISRNIKNGFAISTGLGYSKTFEKYSFNKISSVDTNYTGEMLTVPIYSPVVPDSIIGYDSIPVYTTVTNKTNTNNEFVSRTFFLPIQLSKSFEITDRLLIMASLGGTINIYKTTIDSNSNPLDPEPIRNSVGMNATMRLHAGYKMNNWIFTAGIAGSIYIKTPINYDGLTNKRYFINPQIGVHYLF